MILCVGLAADDTFCHTVSALVRSGTPVDVIDLAQVAYSGGVSLPLWNLNASVLSLHDKRYELGSYKSAWVRLIDIASAAPTEALATKAAGLYQALTRAFRYAPLRMINPPLRDRSNFSKLYHASSLAEMTGWSTPRSCLTTRENDAIAFINSCHDGAIFKGASALKTWATRYDPSQHADRLKLLPSCPVLFQERIHGPDVRIHVVGGHLFAELIESTDLDYRIARNNRYQRVEVPSDIRRGCSTLQQACEAPFLGIDFKICRRTGEWFFLEANSLPAYEGYDRRAKGAISNSIVHWLTQE